MSILQHPRSITALAAAALCALLTPGLSVGADAPVVNEKFADLEPAIQMMRAEVGKDRREIVKANMLLTESESARFWPLYDEYRAEMHKLGDRRVRVITDYAAHRNAMSEDEAHRLTEEALDIEKKRVELKEDYVKKMSKELSPRTVARFMQIDSKLDAIVNAELASQIPLIH